MKLVKIKKLPWIGSFKKHLFFLQLKHPLVEQDSL